LEIFAQLSLTPTEAKKLIAKAIVSLPAVKNAYSGGLIVLHPSSSTYFIAEALLGAVPETNVWVCGVIAPRGTCIEAAGSGARTGNAGKGLPHHPREFSHSWVLDRGRFATGTPLQDLLAAMGRGDVYVKGVNALDAGGNVGILAGNSVEAGTIGMAVNAAKEKGFTLVFPAGLEKLIPGSVFEAAKTAKRSAYQYAMGMSTSLVPCAHGTVITELEAASLISGVEAVSIAAGGLGGAEGSTTLVVRGESAQVEHFIAAAESVKGAALPELRLPHCESCRARELDYCRYPVQGKPWV
jgi:hypothetical protein